MADHFVDSANGNNANTGHTMDAAWATVQYALQSGALVADDYVWVRRNVSEIPTANIIPAYDGTITQPIRVIGCPRASFSITSSDWTNGSTSVVIDDGNMARLQHQGRYITAPDNRQYLITRVVSTTIITIDREYIGSTVTNQPATIQADEDYALFNAIDDSAWTIKKSNWNGDSINLAAINFNNTAVYLSIFDTRTHIFKNFELLNSTSQMIQVDGTNYYTEFVGCLIYITASIPCVYPSNSLVKFKRCIFEGSGSGGNQRAIGSYAGNGIVIMEDCAIYSMGDNAIFCNFCKLELKNVNIGVEVANGDNEIETYNDITGIDIRLGGTNGYVLVRNHSATVAIENYQKILGNHRTFFYGGYYENSLLTGVTTPNKKLSDYAVKITPNVNMHVSNNPEFAHKIFEHRVWADTSSKTYRYWVYNNMSAVINDSTATDNLFLKITYYSGYDDTSEYQYTSAYSTQLDIAQAADAADWDYLEISGVQPAVAGWITMELYQSMYSAAGTIYVDPQPVIS